MQANSPVIRACLFAIDMLMRQVDWRVDPADEENAEAVEIAEFVDQCRDDMSHTWHDFLSEVFSFVTYGYSYHEIVYKIRAGVQAPGSKTPASKYDDQKIGWRKIPIRTQTTQQQWAFDESGGLAGQWQIAPPDYQRVFLPIEKCLLFRPGAHKNNPEGRSALRGAYRPWYFAKRLEDIEAIGVERDLAGLPVMEVPAEITAADATAEQQAAYQAFQKIVRNIRADEQMGVVLPQAYDSDKNPLYKLSLLASAGTKRTDTVPILERYYRQMAMTVMADFLMLGHEKVGSFALASSKTNLFAVALGAWLDSVAETMNRYAIPRLMALNGIDPDLAPKLCHGDIETPELPEIADFVAKLVTAGAPLFPDRKLENQLRIWANLPEISQEEFDAREAAVQEQKDEEMRAQTDMLQMELDSKETIAAKKPKPQA